MLYTATTVNGPAAVRYPRGTGPGVPVQAEMQALPLGRGVVVREGRSGLALLSFGTMLATALAAAEGLDATVVNMRFVKPLDTDLINRVAARHTHLVTLEENVIAGGAGSAVSEVLAEQGHRNAVLHIGIPDRPIMHGSRDSCLAEAGLDAVQVTARIGAWWQPRLQRVADAGR
jgi:1-deoxy-D-xylulose-5-phosphate synthase